MKSKLKIGLGIAALAALTGCVGYVGGGYGGTVFVPGPEVGFYGGGVYERGPDVHAFSQRGSASRAVAHPAGGGGGARR
ncbi:MAG: hypothetical protein ABSA47_16300, partial [Verrucomicrobiota bacterium]